MNGYWDYYLSLPSGLPYYDPTQGCDEGYDTTDEEAEEAYEEGDFLEDEGEDVEEEDDDIGFPEISTTQGPGGSHVAP